jgi:hypothetical protein
LVYTLTDGHQRAAIRALLDDAQRTVVARWLWYRAQVTDALGELTVRKALRAGWADFLAPEQLALLG